MKHANATETSVHIGYIADKTIVRIKIKDNGKGFNPNTTKPGIGLIGMRERVYGINGQITISSTLNEGTTAIIDLPAIPRISDTPSPD